MPRKIGAPRSFVVTEAHNLSLTAAAGDVSTGMVCPGDGAKVVRLSVTTRTAGVGAFNHQLTLEHGLGAAGVALTPAFNVLATAAAGTIVKANGLEPKSQNGGATTVEGTIIQFQNVESGGDITTGAVVDVCVLWQL